jgi:integrase
MISKKAVTAKDTLASLVEAYKRSNGFCSLLSSTQQNYADQLDKVCQTEIKKHGSLGNIKIYKIGIKYVAEGYDQWLAVGTRTANMRAACLSVVFKYAMRDEITDKNPVSLLRRKANNIRSTKWKKEDIRKFLDVAYANFKWRSVGLICHLSYELGQRIGDMRNLKFSTINFDEQRIDIKQSKRGAEVHLPITNALMKMLRQQQQDFGFQEYVCPRPLPIRGQTFTPYNIREVSYLFNEVKAAAEISPSLWASDLRRTALTELGEAPGVDMSQLMMVSGHKNPQSTKPYIVNTFSGASNALALRWQNNG